MGGGTPEIDMATGTFVKHDYITKTNQQKDYKQGYDLYDLYDL